MSILRKIPLVGAILKSALDAAGYKIENLGEPTKSSDAATKQYVDDHGGGGGGLALVPSQEFENCWELVKKYLANQLASAAEVETLAETASGSQIVGKLNEILTAIKGA